MKTELEAGLRERIKELGVVSTAPAIMTPLLELMRRPADEVSIDKVVELVSCDGSIAAQCLRLANSPLFASRQIETVRAAVVSLGIERVRSLLFGLCMNRVVPKEKWVIYSDAFWRHSLGCALVAQRMAKKIQYPKPEVAYLAGLLHDIGFLVNSVLFTEGFRECLRVAAARRGPLHLAEEEILGFTHCETGQILCEQWGLSAELCSAIRHHHDNSPPAIAGAPACLVHLSDLLCRTCELGYGYEEVLAVELSHDPAWLILAEAYPALAEVDLARFTLDTEGAMDQIVATVNSVFGASSAAAAPGKN